MEKYTVDIDKVLDDFEESEALKLQNDENTQGSITHSSIDLNISSSSSTSVITTTPGNTSNARSLSLDETSKHLSNLLLTFSTVTASESPHEISIKNRLTDEKDKIASCAKEKHLSFDIYYQSSEVKQCNSSVCNSSVVTSSEENADLAGDEILCVSVEEISCEKEVGGTINRRIDLPACQVLDQDVSHINQVVSNENSGIATQSDDVENFSFNAHSETQTENESKILSQVNMSEIVNVQQDTSPHYFGLTLPAAESQDINCTSVKFVDYSGPIAANSSDTVYPHIREQFVGVEPNILNDPDFDEMQDDDSGVSSQDDLNGNSPPENIHEHRVMNTPPGKGLGQLTVLHEKNTILNKSDPQSLPEQDISHDSFTEIVDITDLPIPDVQLNEDNTPKESSSECKITEVYSSAKDAVVSFNNIEQNLKAVENSVSELEAPVTDSTSQEDKGRDVEWLPAKTFSAVLNNKAVATNISEISISNINHSSDSAKNVSSNGLENYSQGFPINSNLDSEFDCDMNIDCAQLTLASKVLSNPKPDNLDDINVVYESIPENISNNNILSHNIIELENNTVSRLQRPTTLDLPPRHTHVKSNTQIEDLSSDCLHEQLVDIDCQSEVSVGDTTISETVYVSQEPLLGFVKPYWTPDAEAPNCMHCGLKFSVIKRRHHCRVCGKVLCSRCCNRRAFIPYLNKEDRICSLCSEEMKTKIQSLQPSTIPAESSSSSCGSSPNFSPVPQTSSSTFSDQNTWKPHPNNPDDYCSTIPPLEQIQMSGSKPPPTVMVPTGVLKRGNKPRKFGKEAKQVVFSDGIRPGGDLLDLNETVETVAVHHADRKRVNRLLSESASNSSVLYNSNAPAHPKLKQKVIISDEVGLLPPMIVHTDHIDTGMNDWNQIFELLKNEELKAISLTLLKNLQVYCKISKLDCCFGNECWCFTTKGLCTVGQDEVMILLERKPDERTIPRDIFKLFIHLYDSASKGVTFEELGHVIFSEGLFGNFDHRGFFFVRPSFQCLSKLILPSLPYLVGLLIHKWEVPWAKVFPLRLMLRMGAECRYYPCALVSIRDRKPVYFEIGQTIMSVLADLRNYQFTIPVIPGLIVHMEEKKTYVNIPRNRYKRIMKVLNNNNVEHVLALGSNFSTEADSHLVCMQKEEGNYYTQAINIENRERKVTGASFIVFSGALKSSSGLSAKFSIVEDGLLIQIPQDTMVSLHMALRDMKDLSIQCGKVNSEPEEKIFLQWTKDDLKFNTGIQSPIDGRSFEGIPNLRIHTSTDYASERFLIRWTEVFFLEYNEIGNSMQNELVDPCRLADAIAQSCCMALTPYLDQLAESELSKLGLRVSIDLEKDRVEYDVGAQKKPLPALYMNALDHSLIPVILRHSHSTQSDKLAFELIFHILVK